jgi:His/Glu/Gln/Arg/opine family amino acid ABC transporter permease subunit
MPITAKLTGYLVRPNRKTLLGLAITLSFLGILVWAWSSGAFCAWSPLACRYFSEVAPMVVVNLQWALVAIGVGFVFGFLLGWARVSRFVLLRGASRAYTELIRGTPLLIQIFAVFYIVPALNRALEPQGINFALSGAQRVVLALILNTSAYQAEIFRAGFQTIAKGQLEAAASIGMTRMQTMRHVILPQSLRIMTPPLTNEYIIMFKDATPLAFIVAVPELVRGAIRFGQQTQAIFETYLLTAFVFLVFSLILTGLLRFLERRFRIPGLGISVRAGE